MSLIINVLFVTTLLLISGGFFARREAGRINIALGFITLIAGIYFLVTAIGAASSGCS